MISLVTVLGTSAGTARAGPSAQPNAAVAAASTAAHVVVGAFPARVWTSDSGKATSTVVAIFTDSSGRPVANLPVSWSTTAGSLSTASGKTDTHGQARVLLTQPSAIAPSKEVGVIATDADKTSLRSYAGVEFVPNTISIYPKSPARGPWEWYQSCRFVPAAKIPPSSKSGCQHSDPIFGPVVLNGDLWNLGTSASGDVMMRNASSGNLSVGVDFPSAPGASRSTWVLGYPNISYGVTPQAPADSPKPTASLPLPMKLEALPKDLIATTDYKLAGTSSVKYDFAYDIWLEPQHTVETPRAGTLEVMVWTADGNGALPPGYKKTLPMDFVSDGVRRTGQWGVYIANGDKSGGTTTTVQLVLTQSVTTGKVSVDLTSAFLNVESALKQYDSTHWSSFSNYYLDSIDLGSEFGRKNGHTGAGPFSWNLYDYGLGLGMKLP